MPTPHDRRSFLWSLGGGLGGIALAHLLGTEGLLADEAKPARKPADGLHHPAKAKRVVQLFMSGAASQCDTFDYKPELIRRHGQKFDPGGKVELFQSSPGAVMKSPWEWKQRGESGRWVSDLLPHLAGCVDDMAFLYSMVSKSNVHGPATFLQATGFVAPGFPAMGAWVTYGLGSLNENLPAFVVLPDSRGFAPNGPANWGAGFLPASTQGTLVRPGSKTPIFDLYPPRDAEGTGPEAEREALALLDRMNRDHRKGREADTRLDARIASYELAARLQPQLAPPRPSGRSRRRSRPRRRRLYVASTIRRPRTSAAIASSPAACWSGACGSSRSGTAPTTASPGGTGTRTRTSPATTA